MNKKSYLFIAALAFMATAFVSCTKPDPQPAPDDEQQQEQPQQSQQEQPAGKTVVSKENFPDCDGSGHGYYEIHYSDGSVEYQQY